MKRGLIVLTLLFFFFRNDLAAQEQMDFYDISTIQKVKITFSDKNWPYLLDSLRYNGDEFLQGKVEINGKVFSGAGIRYRSSRSFTPGAKRNSLLIKLDYKDYGANYLTHSKLVLSSALRDPSMIREVMALEVARNYMPAPEANFAEVTVNDQPYGFFANIEAVDKPFLERYFGDAKESLYRSNPRFEEREEIGCRNKVYGSLQHDMALECYDHNFDDLTGKGWKDLMELTRMLIEEPDGIEQILNVDRTLWMHAFNNVMVNLSSYSGQYSQNYLLYLDDTRHFNPIIWDLNLAFGSYKNTGVGSDLGTIGTLQLDPALHADNSSTPLISVLLNNEMYKKKYFAHIRTILYEQILNGKFEKRARELHELIGEHFKADDHQYYTLKDYEKSLDATVGTRSKIPGVVDFMTKRANWLKLHPNIAVLPPVIKDIDVVSRERFSRDEITDFNIRAKVEKYAKKVKLFYRFSEGEPFQEATMLDDGKQNDGSENDEVYGIKIRPTKGASVIEYYIFAENARAVSYEPSNYMFNRYTADLTELNK